MALFAVTLTDQTTDFVEDADAYQQEGPMTTFFSFRDDRHVIDSWAVRLASYKTADISAIRRSSAAAAPPGPAEVAQLAGDLSLGTDPHMTAA